MRFSVLNILLSFSISVFSQESKLFTDSVVIKYASWEIVTDIGIKCANFETSIDYLIYTEKDSSTISKLINELDILKPTQKGGEDIRCKLVFYHSDKICRSDCIGSIITRKESGYFYTSPKLKTIIDSIVNNSQIKLRKENIEKWDPCPSTQRIYQYLSSQSGRFYNGIKLEEDLAFTVFCNVGEEGNTINIQFSKNSKDIPIQISSTIEDILYHEIKWDTPPHHKSQWVPINILIKANRKQNNYVD